MIDSLDHIKNEPDLQDFIEYCKPILKKVEHIQKKIQQLSIQNKVKNINIDISYRLDSIVNKYLPNSIQSYLNLTFEYRNTKKIKVGEQELTPKEALLLNLTHIDKQINQIEEEFNEENKLSLVVQNRLLREMPQAELAPENKFINQFDIKNFKHDITDEEIISSQEYIEGIDADEAQPRSGFSLIEILIVLITTGLVMGFALITLGRAQESAKGDAYFREIIEIENTISNLHKQGISKITTKTIQAIIPHNELIQSGTEIVDSDSNYSINVKTNSENECITTIKKSHPIFDEIKVFANSINQEQKSFTIKDKKTLIPNTTDLISACNIKSDSTHTISFTNLSPVKSIDPIAFYKNEQIINLYAKTLSHVYDNVYELKLKQLEQDNKTKSSSNRSQK